MEPYDWDNYSPVDPVLMAVPLIGPLLVLGRRVIGFIGHYFAQFGNLVGEGLPDAPAEFAGLCGEWQTHLTWINPLAAWIPWGYLGTAAAITFSGLVMGTGLKVVLKMISLKTGGGGAT